MSTTSIIIHINLLYNQNELIRNGYYRIFLFLSFIANTEVVDPLRADPHIGRRSSLKLCVILSPMATSPPVPVLSGWFIQIQSNKSEEKRPRATNDEEIRTICVYLIRSLNTWTIFS